MPSSVIWKSCCRTIRGVSACGARLMLALYRSQRQTEALRAFQRARGALVEALGVEPSAELRAIESGILRGDPTLDLTAPSSAAAKSEVADAPMSRLMEWTMSAPAFIGRDVEFDELSSRWEAVRAGGCSFVFIGGDPGIGKTRPQRRSR